MLSKYANRDFIKKHFFKKPEPMFHSIADREYWESAAKILYDRMKRWEKETFEDLYKPLLATDYMRFERDGNRSIYENIYFSRRKALFTATALEAMENNGVRTETIVNLVWMILEETTWCIPAHSSQARNSDSLPATDQYVLDLFASETGALLVWVYNILKERLDEVSRNIAPRIIEKVKQRVCDTYLNHNFAWMAFDENKVNNWNPWINSNVILTVQTVYGDCEKAWELMEKYMKSLERYYVCQPNDGACDEGAVYWNYSHMTFLEALYALYAYSNGAIDMFSETKVSNMLGFFESMYIGNGYVVNFADCSARYAGDYGVIHKFARITKNENMFNFGKVLFDENGQIENLSGQKGIRIFDAMEAECEYKNMPPVNQVVQDSYYDSIQVMTKKLANGIFFAAKGGNNGESHNHNDVGSFILYKNNKPFIIDSGNMQYTKDTFTDKRYTIWTNMSEYHNLPKIDGCNQKAGALYQAEGVVLEKDFFRMDISKAYGGDNIRHWVRAFNFSEDAINISEVFDFEKETEVVLNFVTAVRPEVKDNCVTLINGDGTLKMYINTEKFKVNVEEIDTSTDKNLSASWTGNIYRMRLSFLSTGEEISYSFS